MSREIRAAQQFYSRLATTRKPLCQGHLRQRMESRQPTTENRISAAETIEDTEQKEPQINADGRR